MIDLAHPDAPFWADDFDMDLPKVVPEARESLGDLATVVLTTEGTPDWRFGNLNDPAVWNHDLGSVAWFGADGPRRPLGYVAVVAAPIRCSVWQAFRDAWAHSFLMFVNEQPVWNTQARRRDFQTILHDLRGWGAVRVDAAGAKKRTLDSIGQQQRRFVSR